jgi:hypothetical protein
VKAKNEPSNVTFDLMVGELDIRSAKTPLAMFIQQRIQTCKGAKPLTTTAIFEAFNEWATENGQPLHKSNITFGIELGLYKEKFWS